jgi:hypothetical protein
MLRLLVPEPTKFDQLPRALGALQDVEVLWIGKIQLFGASTPTFSEWNGRYSQCAQD